LISDWQLTILNKNVNKNHTVARSAKVLEGQRRKSVDKGKIRPVASHAKTPYPLLTKIIMVVHVDCWSSNREPASSEPHTDARDGRPRVLPLNLRRPVVFYREKSATKADCYTQLSPPAISYTRKVPLRRMY